MARKLPLRPHATVASPQTMAMAVALLTRPQRSAIKEIGKVMRPTVRATTLTRAPSWVSLKAHSALSEGNTALITWRDM
ncbi:hypothetical protein D3C76_1579160 [compost metagenome]